MRPPRCVPAYRQLGKSVGAFGATSRLWTGCSASPTSSQATPAPAENEKVTFGFIYVGPKDDYGYNQAHAEGTKAIAAKFPWIKLVEEASIPETILTRQLEPDSLLEKR